MPTTVLRNLCVAQSGSLGLSGASNSSKRLPNKKRIGNAVSQPRVPKAASSDPSVLLNVSTHSDGTITYCFGAEVEKPAVVPIPSHNGHYHEASEPVTVPLAASPVSNGQTSSTHQLQTSTTTAAAQQLDKLLHLTSSQLVNGNGRSGERLHVVSGSKHRLDTAAEAAAQKRSAKHTQARTPQPRYRSQSPQPIADLQSIEYAAVSAVSIEKLYSRLCDAEQLDDALHVLKESIRAGREDAIRMLKHYKFLRPAQRQRSVRRALRFIQLLPRQFADARTYNMVLSVCAEAGDVKSALRVADIYRASGHKMDTILYTNIIKACAAAGDAEHAFALYSEMKSAGVKMEKQVYATLISACSEQIANTPLSDRRTQLVLLERAFSLIQGMQSARLNPDAAVWNSLVTVAGRAGQLQRAFDILEEMIAAGTRPNGRTYSSLIDACARTGDKDLALRVYSKSRREGFTLELLIYSAAINACVRCRDGADLEAAMSIYADMQREGVAPDSSLYGALIMAAGRSGDLGLALDLEAEMEREGLEPCSGTKSALLTSYVQNGKLAEAQAIYRSLRAANVAPHIHAANSLLNALGKQLRLGDVVAMVCDMVEAGLTPDVFTFTAVLNACQWSDESELGLDVYRVMRVRGLKPDSNVAGIMIKMCYNRMRQSWRTGGYPPQRLSDDEEEVVLGVHSHHGKTMRNAASNLLHPSTRYTDGHRGQERMKLLSALTPPGKKVSLSAEGLATNNTVNWQAQALHIYREALSSGVKPSMKLLNMMCSCLRVPWEEATGMVGGDPALDLASQTQRLLAGLPSTNENTLTVQGKIGVESIYHVRAISILEEAIVAGILPSFKTDGIGPIDLRTLPPSVAEVYVLTVVSALQRHIEARRDLQNRLVFLVPRYDGHKVFMPSFLRDEEEARQGKEKGDRASQTNKSNKKTSGALYVVNEDSDADDDEDDYLFKGALKSHEECTGDERTGLGVAGVLRRLRLWSREYSPEGLVVVEPKQISRWAKMIQRQVEKRSASALALQKPYGQTLSGDLRRQSSTIRMGL